MYGRTAFRVGAWAWLVTGVGHLAMLAVQRLRAEEPAAVTAMREHQVAIAGLSRSLYELDLGMSFVMGVALIFGGLVCLRVARFGPELVTRALSGLALAASLIVLCLSALLLPAPPIVFFLVACVAFGSALVASRRAVAQS